MGNLVPLEPSGDDQQYFLDLSNKDCIEVKLFVICISFVLERRQNSRYKRQSVL